MDVKQEIWDFLPSHQTPGFVESLYSLAHYPEVWAGEKELYAKTVSLRNTLFINMENLGGNKEEKKIPFCLFAQGRLEKKEKILIKSRKDSVILEKRSIKPWVFTLLSKLCIYALWKCVGCSVKIKLKSCEVFWQQRFLFLFTFFPHISTSPVKNLTVRLHLQSWVALVKAYITLLSRFYCFCFVVCFFWGGRGGFFVVVVFWGFFLVNHTDFTVMQIEMETQIRSGARHALISTRECQAMLNLGDYLCCSLNASSAALACKAARQSRQGRDTSPVSMWCCSTSPPPQILTLLWVLHRQDRTGTQKAVHACLSWWYQLWGIAVVVFLAKLYSCAAGHNEKFLFITLP